MVTPPVGGAPSQVVAPLLVTHIGALPRRDHDLQPRLRPRGAEWNDRPARRPVDAVEREQQARALRQRAAQVVGDQRAQAVRRPVIIAEPVKIAMDDDQAVGQQIQRRLLAGGLVTNTGRREDDLSLRRRLHPRDPACKQGVLARPVGATSSSNGCCGSARKASRAASSASRPPKTLAAW